MSAVKHKVVKVGIMPLDEFKKRSIAIAKGKYKPKKDEPKIWFRSMKSLAHVLSEENQDLLKLIRAANKLHIHKIRIISCVDRLAAKAKAFKFRNPVVNVR